MPCCFEWGVIKMSMSTAYHAQLHSLISPCQEDVRAEGWLSWQQLKPWPGTRGAGCIEVCLARAIMGKPSADQSWGALGQQVMCQSCSGDSLKVFFVGLVIESIEKRMVNLRIFPWVCIILACWIKMSNVYVNITDLWALRTSSFLEEEGL